MYLPLTPMQIFVCLFLPYVIVLLLFSIVVLISANKFERRGKRKDPKEKASSVSKHIGIKILITFPLIIAFSFCIINILPDSRNDDNRPNAALAMGHLVIFMIFVLTFASYIDCLVENVFPSDNAISNVTVDGLNPANKNPTKFESFDVDKTCQLNQMTADKLFDCDSKCANKPLTSSEFFYVLKKNIVFPIMIVLVSCVCIFMFLIGR